MAALGRGRRPAPARARHVRCGRSAAHALPATAVTSLLLTDDSRMLLAGCADGRLCVVADPALAQRTLAMQLQQGLFGLAL